MQAHAIDMITLSREFGAGGSDLAQRVGSELGWRVLDQDIVALVADRLNLSATTVARIDEHPPGLLARLSSALLMSRPEAPITLDTSEFLSPDAVADAARATMLDAAGSAPLIIVGHGSQCLFRARLGTLHVRLTASVEDRVARICSREPCESATAAAQVRRMDADRAAYVRRYYQSDWRDPELYDVQLNTSRLSLNAAATAILAIVRESRS